MSMRKFLPLWIFLLGSLFIANQLTAEPPTSRIIDGTAVSETQYPHVARLTVGGELLCTGTLVGSRHVLTAAHCFFGDNNKRAVGETDVVARINGTEYRSAAVTIHPSYRSRAGACVEKETDAAVIELSNDVAGLTPIPLLDSPVPVGASVLLAGYGTQGTGSTGQDDTIPPVGTINIGSTVVEGFGDNVGEQDTSSSYYYWVFGNGESNTASGDSGGPAFYDVGGQFFISGITCGGGGNAEFTTDSFNTRADLIKAWVDSITGTTPSETPAGFSATTPKGAIVGQAFSYNIPVVGSQPITLTSIGLPDGLTINGSTISGTATTPGTYIVQLSASNAFGSAITELAIIVTAFDGVLTMKKALLQFDYKKGAQDFLDISGTIGVGADFNPKNVKVLVQIGRFKKQFKLKANGESAGNPTSYFDLVGSFKKGNKFKQSTVKFFLTLEKVKIFEELATLGFPSSANASAGQEVSLPLSVTINDIELSTAVNLSFRPSDARWRIKK